MFSLIAFLTILATSSSQQQQNYDCGRVTPLADPLVVGGSRAQRGELPWHVGVYQKTSRPYRQICGGSIIAQKLVISAAHCFWNTVDELAPASDFAVAAGKIFKPWYEDQDPDAQYSDVDELLIPRLFRGVDRNYAEDLALLVLERAFQYKPYLSPVCVDFDPRLEESQLRPGNLGKVAGWGLTSSDGQNTVALNVIDLPVVAINECLEKSPKNYWQYITIDKICAGYDNGTATLCQGDSGGGLVFPHTTEPGVERYFLRGVVSTSPRSSTECNTFAIASFTKISVHRSFIELRYKPEEEPMPVNSGVGLSSSSESVSTGSRPTDCGSGLVDGSKRIQVPWHVDIYRTDTSPCRHVCGGSIFNPGLIITAAHCFFENGQRVKDDAFMVVAGKTNKAVYDVSDANIQARNISSARRPFVFNKGNENNGDDVAVILLNSSLVFNDRIRPICLTYSAHPRIGEIGKIASWPPLGVNSSSERLRVLSLRSEGRAGCVGHPPPRNPDESKNNKFCATGQHALCQQNAGNGIAFLRTRPGDGAPRYFLMGIVGGHTARADSWNEPCRGSNLTAFTIVTPHVIVAPTNELT